MQIIYNRRPVNHASFPLCVCVLDKVWVQRLQILQRVHRIEKRRNLTSDGRHGLGVKPGWQLKSSNELLNLGGLNFGVEVIIDMI